MVGVMIAGAVTHQLIPWLLAERVPSFRHLPVPTFAAIERLIWPRALCVAATLTAALWMAWPQGSWWETDLAAISPVSAAMRAQDAELRRELGAPEVSMMLASRGATEAAALQAAESMLPTLRAWQREGWIRSFDSPALYLPTAATQAARQQALPDANTLERNLREAQRGLSFRADAFSPFLDEVERARTGPLLTRAAYAGTPLGAKLNALFVELDGKWLVLTPLVGVSEGGRLSNALAVSAPRNGNLTGSNGAAINQLIDLKQVSAEMVNGFRHQALLQSAWGAALILLLLVGGLRSLRRAWRVLAPVAAAMVLTVSLLVATGQRISVFHLVALLLVLGIGLNYALFFERTPEDESELARIRLSLAVCAVSTIATFGILAFSATPVLHTIGITVALGAFLSLLVSALWAPRWHRQWAAQANDEARSAGEPEPNLP
jgi:predicted exporter